MRVIVNIVDEMMTEYEKSQKRNEEYRRSIGAICKSCGGTLAHVMSDGDEAETWICESCETEWLVGITATRHFDEMEREA